MRFLIFSVLLVASSLVFSQNISKTQKKDSPQTTQVTNVKVSTNNLNISDLDDEKTEVLIDSGFSGYQSFSENQDDDSIPYSIGVFKGIFVFDGRNLLVFESDDGTLNFVQIFKQGNKIKWKIYFQLRRI